MRHTVCSVAMFKNVNCSVVSDFLRPRGLSPPGSSVHGILQARILEWVAIPFSRGSSWLWGQTWVSCIADRFLTFWATFYLCSIFLKDNRSSLMRRGCFPHSSVSKESACNAGIRWLCRRLGFNSCVQKIPWRRKWKPGDSSNWGQAYVLFVVKSPLKMAFKKLKKLWSNELK